jgi:hypothetical protein
VFEANARFSAALFLQLSDMANAGFVRLTQRMWFDAC